MQDYALAASQLLKQVNSQQDATSGGESTLPAENCGIRGSREHKMSPNWVTYNL